MTDDERHIPDVLEEHLEELTFLWGQRRNALFSAELTLRELGLLEERIAAHADGLAVAGYHAIPLLKEALSASKPAAAFAAAYPLLLSGERDSSRLVLEAFRTAEGGGLTGLREALAHGPIDAIQGDLQQLARDMPSLRAVAAADALSFHGSLDLAADTLNRLLRHEQADVRKAGWRLASRNASPRPRDLYQAGLADPDPAVRAETLRAAAWGAQAWLLDDCRKRAARPLTDMRDALSMLAILGRPSDLHAISLAGNARELGPLRFQLLGTFGHPETMGTILQGLRDADPRTAVAAGAAFTKITGVGIAVGLRVSLPPVDGSQPDAFEAEFLETATLPDADRAANAWSERKEAYANGTRWCRGENVSRDGVIPAALDLESRWEACLRGMYHGQWPGNPVDLERFPQPLPVRTGKAHP